MTPQTEHLRTTLHRLADAGVPLPVDDDLWGRAQSARRRGQALAVAAVLVLVVTVGGVASVWPTADFESRTAAQEVPGGAIPRVIADVPDNLEATAVEDLDLGRASAAFISSDGDPVVLTAGDGTAHRLDLVSRDADSLALALSPDGTRVAFQEDPGVGVTYLAVLDLTTGTTRRWVVNPDDGLVIDMVAWSPGGTRLGWVSSAIGSTPAWAGTIRADGTDAVSSVLTRNASSIAVADDGDAALGQVDGGLRLLPLNGDGDAVDLPVQVGVGSFAPDGAQVALSGGPGTASYTFDLRDRGLSTHPFPDGTLGESVVRPLGWVDDRIQLLLVQPVDGSGAELVVTTPEVDDQSTWRRRVGSVETSGVANSLSVAVDLVPDLDGTSSQELTHDFGTTTTPERDVSWMVGLGVAGAIAGLMALRWLWRRLRTPV